jgi:hypothetical protein
MALPTVSIATKPSAELALTKPPFMTPPHLWHFNDRGEQTYIPQLNRGT